MLAGSASPGEPAASKHVAGSAVETVLGITAPAKTAVVGAVHPARIAHILIEEGGSVLEGDLLIELEDAVQRRRTEIAKAEADSTLGIDLAREKWKHAKSELERLTKLEAQNQASPKELIDAKAEAEITRIQLDMAQVDHEQDLRAYQREQAILDDYRIRAPFSAYVSVQHKHDGETVDQLEGILTLVQLDPLHVTVDCPLSLAPSVRIGDRVLVRPSEPSVSPRHGTVTLTHRVADGASQTFKVRVALENEDAAWMSGLKVAIDFPLPKTTATPPEEASPKLTAHKAKDEQEPARERPAQ